MQTIEHNYKHELKTLCQVEKLYSQLSEYSVMIEENNKMKLADDIEVPDILTELLYTFYQYNQFVPVHFYEDTYTPIETVKDSKFMLVCASGGKDSTALTKMLKARGYSVLLYHMKGINPAYWDEFKAVKNVSISLDVPYHIEEVKLKGKHQYIEHPMKNMLIANGAIQFCLDNNLPVNIAFGNYESSRLEDMDFEIDGGDSRDMWDIYERIIRNEIPDFRIYTPLNDVSKTYELLTNWKDADLNLELISKSISCMSPYRFRKHWAERTTKKYHVQLLPNRCGCCWKCCMEYMVLVDNGYKVYNKKYYRYCFDRLWKTAEKETGLEAETVGQIWNRYFWYDILRSHLYY